MRTTRTLAAALVLAAAAGCGSVPSASDAADLGAILARAKARVFPALVFVSPVVERFQAGERLRQEVVGSGVLISPDGEVVTNRHVVDKAVEIRCLLHDGRVLKAKVIGQDKDTDLALVKLLGQEAGTVRPDAAKDPMSVIERLEGMTVPGAEEPVPPEAMARIREMLRAKAALPEGEAVATPAVAADTFDESADDAAPPESSEVFPYAELADSSEVFEGQFVMAMGAPWGMSRSVSLGIVSCTRRFLPGTGEYSLWLQTDAALNPGNSGGPLVDTEGRVVGINTLATMMGGDMGFAVPSNTVKEVIDAIRREGRVNRAWTGIHLQPLKDFKRNTFYNAEHGVLVAGVAPGSPAAKAGLKAGDLLVSVGGRPTDGVTDEDLPAIRSLLAKLPVGEEVALSVERAGGPLVIALVPREKGKVEGDDFDCKKWNMTVKAINEFATPELYYYVNKGVYVQGVRSPGNAAEAGLRRGDVVARIDGAPITSLDELSAHYEKIVSDESAPKRVRIEILRAGLPRQIVLDYSTKYERE